MTTTHQQDLVAARSNRLASWIESPSADHEYVTHSAKVQEDGGTATPAEMALMDAGVVFGLIEKSLPQIVQAARNEGMTWERIGEALGMTKQGAQQRFGRVSYEMSNEEKMRLASRQVASREQWR